LHSGGVKPTNAVVLAKGADHIRHLTATREEQMIQRAALNEKIARLNQRISALQSNLPSSSGSTSTKLEPRAALEAFYDRYTKERSRKDYRFWVVSVLSCTVLSVVVPRTFLEWNVFVKTDRSGNVMQLEASYLVCCSPLLLCVVHCFAAFGRGNR
uniref:PHM7_cyt domain-containing protein n=1 Tax=Heligmosomoides polygyrus TaxID=6339 RepID=A0A183GBE6_HELPZ